MNINITNISFSYSETDVLDEISFNIESGKLVGIVGPNGAGKTTVLHCIAGILTPNSGSIRLAGQSIAELSSQEVSQRVALVPQNPNIGFDFTVREVVGMGRHPQRPRIGRDPDAEKITQALEQTQTAQFENRKITEISGGETRRVFLARAIAQDTAALLLDEPTASLDINHQIKTLKMISEFAAKEKTILAAIHDLNLASRFCDELIVLSGGSIIASGPPTEVLTSDIIRSAFNTPATVVENPVTNTPHVTSLPDHTNSLEGHIHVIPSQNDSDLIAALDAHGFDVTVGIVPEGAEVANFAQSLGCEVITTSPYSVISDQEFQEMASIVAGTDVTIVGGNDVYTNTEANIKIANQSDQTIIISPSAPARAGENESSNEVQPYQACGKTINKSELCEVLADAIETSEDKFNQHLLTH
ncbi:MAG: heme ABC transporter ATP-binding protein [Halobacteriaceae archaeon]